MAEEIDEIKLALNEMFEGATGSLEEYDTFQKGRVCTDLKQALQKRADFMATYCATEEDETLWRKGQGSYHEALRFIDMLDSISEIMTSNQKETANA